MGPTEVREICKLDETGRGLVRAAMQQLQMSARAFHRILKLARTIADLAGSERIETPLGRSDPVPATKDSLSQTVLCCQLGLRSLESA
jgi:repressor of nif and glnA expression